LGLELANLSPYNNKKIIYATGSDLTCLIGRPSRTQVTATLKGKLVHYYTFSKKLVLVKQDQRETRTWSNKNMDIDALMI